MAENERYIIKGYEEPENEVGTITSVLAGIGSGLIKIPEGLFSLGASLIDLGAGTNTAAKVESFFDKINPLDELAEATTAGKLTEILVNLGVPGGIAFTKGASLASNAIKAKGAGKYLTTNNKELVEAGKQAVRLNNKGKTAKFAAGALGAGVADGVFVADVSEVGTFGDLLGGPTQINREGKDFDPGRDILNRLKFGTESVLFSGLLGGTGLSIKKMANSNKMLSRSKDKMSTFFDKFASKFRSRGKLDELAFQIGKTKEGLREVDASIATEAERNLTKIVNGWFPSLKGKLYKTPKGQLDNEQKKKQIFKELNDILTDTSTLTAKGVDEATFDSQTKSRQFAKDQFEKSANEKLGISSPKQGEDIFRFKFGELGDTQKEKLKKILKSPDYGLKNVEVGDIFNDMNTIRGSWDELLTKVGRNMTQKELKEFKGIIGQKVGDLLTSNYKIFGNKSLVPYFNYKPSEQLINKFKQTLVDNNGLTSEQAETAINTILETARLPGKKSLAVLGGRSPAALFNLPASLVKESILSETAYKAFTKNPDRKLASINDLNPEFKKMVEDLYGKQNNAAITIIGGTERLSILARENEYFKSLAKESETLVENAQKLTKEEMIEKAQYAIAEGGEGLSKEQAFKKYVDYRGGEGISKEEAIKKYKLFFTPEEYGNVAEEAAREIWGKNAKQIEFNIPDESMAGGVNPLRNAWTSAAMADAVTGANKDLISNSNTFGYVWNNFVLLPKATSQMAKTIFSAITHVRNFVSGGAFATANGNIDFTGKAYKRAYQSLQIPMKGARQDNDFYNMLLKYKVVSSNARLGDQKELIKRMEFLGENLNPNNMVAKMFKVAQQTKKVGEDFYTAGDDFWKISGFILEHQNLVDNYAKYAIKRSKEELLSEAADIIKNTVPNYNYVSDFVKGLRKFPVGNFVSFPAEMIRTSTNIVQRAIKEINYSHTLANGQVVKPLEKRGYRRLVGFGVTATAVPYATVEGAKALYNVTEEEMEALRRYVPSWSKNSTLVPIRDKKTGDLKYIDFSRTNVYDTITRPVQVVLNSIQSGKTDEDGLMNDFMKGLFEATKETVSPFISESIWTEASMDILARGGRTREGKVLYTDQTPFGEKASTIIKHLVESQTPGSLAAFNRIGLTIKGETDEYGRSFELGDELAGLAGFRVTPVDPEKAINFKIAKYQTGIRNSRREFTSKLLKGGDITPGDIVDRYQIANKAAYKVKQEMMKDYFAALKLGASPFSVRKSFEERGVKTDLRFIQRGRFKPIEISDSVQDKFRENARNIGKANPYTAARTYINSILRVYQNTPLGLSELPTLPNPFKEVELPANNTSYFQPLSNIEGEDILSVAGAGTVPNGGGVNIANSSNYGTTPNATINSFGQIVKNTTV